jgi:SagB-type dehydrogenase family enzyme
MNDYEIALGYHAATKHHVNRYARSMGYLDWNTQPDPFRRYDGATMSLLPFQKAEASPLYDHIFEPGRAAPRPFSIGALSEFFERSLAISAWKQAGDSRWALRCNPSSGNLHPTEGYLVAPALVGLGDSPGVYHYAPREHGLERRCNFTNSVWERLAAEFPEDVFIAGLSSIHWREAWKYGERAYRYCQHDIGHALTAYVLAAATLGWSVSHLDGVGDAGVATLLGLDRDRDFVGAEPEHPDILVAVIPLGRTAPLPRILPEDAIQDVAAGTWQGHANALSPDHVLWEIIDSVADACAKPRGVFGNIPSRQAVSVPSPGRGASAPHIIAQRRSAVDMDAQTFIPRGAFYHMLLRTMPFDESIPWSALPVADAVHLGIFVHRVTGLVPGLYCLIRNADDESELRSAMNREFLWETPDACPDALPLYLLRAGDYRDTAAQVSCGQDIAADGAFSLGMFARFEEPLQRYGPWFYRRLFWETGAIGQVLYLEAEAAGVRATGIGCFFDDSFHHCLGLNGWNYQSLYHFTVGGPVDDPRLTTLPAYSAERRERLAR